MSRDLGRRGSALLLSLLFHALIFALFSGGRGFGLPGVGLPWQERRASPRDLFVVPSWMPCRFETKGECVLFSFSDRPAQLALGLWREQRG